MLKTYRLYYKILEKRKRVKPKVIWTPFGRWYDKKFNFKGKLVLDFGSGVRSNFFLKYVRDNNGNTKKYKGYDIDETALKWLVENNFYYDFYRDNTFLGSFDLINCSQVYEHLDLSERECFIKRSYELLKPGGILLIDIPHIANLNIIEFFRRDRAHKPVSREDEAIYIELFGFKCELYLAGLTMPYMSRFKNFWNIIMNLLHGFYPQWLTIIVAKKVEA
jgi:SAM-dependent methyltransferase